MASYQNSIFLNLPVADVEASVKFYSAIGFVQTKSFSTPQGAQVCYPATSTSNPHHSQVKIMLLSHDFFKGFMGSGRTIADPRTTSQHIICISRESKESVDEMALKVKAAGGEIDIREKLDLEKQMDEMGMHGRTFTDLDGHLFEVMFMPPAMYENAQ